MEGMALSVFVRIYFTFTLIKDCIDSDSFCKMLTKIIILKMFESISRYFLRQQQLH